VRHGLYVGAVVYAFSGRPLDAAANANRALRLSPFDPLAFNAYFALGTAAIQEGRYDDAASNIARTVQLNPRFSSLYFFHAASLALAGRQREARPVATRLLELEPGFRSRFVFELGLAQVIVDRLAEGARLLGLPE
jgi:tetratricopeptide (TPR) repeat protein